MTPEALVALDALLDTGAVTIVAHHPLAPWARRVVVNADGTVHSIMEGGGGYADRRAWAEYVWADAQSLGRYQVIIPPFYADTADVLPPTLAGMLRKRFAERRAGRQSGD